ncbi:CYFIP-related Rac1 interactor B [Caerostris extrusa]|uniref:CYFIP-related Rac1 interactor B n=1 Tax=Caerostris extrusa TaxID=172846 RepID=A0AAV4XKZ4_CAEEX|nr:CYFIP-related Rac1 interactor B [Caerostris extrusa]
MTNPGIQNDFSYYRRTVSRLRLANQEPIDEELEVPNELANKMSLFYAHATPMLKVLSDATMRFVAENKDLPIENTTETLGTMAKVCQRMIEHRDFCSLGAFAKSAHIDVKGSIKVLKDQPPNVVEGLLNALRYTTRHLNDESTRSISKAY